MSIGVDRLGTCSFFLIFFLFSCNSSSTWILWLHLVGVVLSMGLSFRSASYVLSYYHAWDII